MEKNIIHRVAAAFMVVVISTSAICVPASAVGLADTDSVQLWTAAVQTPSNSVISAIAAYFGCTADATNAFWSLMNTAVGPTGEKSLDYLTDMVGQYNQAFNSEYYDGFFQTVFKNSQALGRQSFASCFFGLGSMQFELAVHPSSGLYRIREKNSGRWVVNHDGLYPFCWGLKEAPTSGGNQWIGERSCSTAKTNMKNLDTLNLLCNKIKESGTPCQIRALGTNYKAIWYNRQYYCDPEGRPFVCYANESQAAVNQDRPDTSVTDEKGEPAKDETGTVINNPDNSTNIDLSGMTITLPNGTVQVADAVIYDESTKTYYIDSHDTTNYNITYNYSWTYHINYTSITYIGTTAEYDKYYEVYYELPDGRDSADLTAEELEQLDFNIDVVNYGRSADDTSLRSLYHFDGDTRDSSYWNYCTGFNWISGASITYMDASAFNGALYLDENLHEYTFTLPSNVGNGDFTMQFRYYQSYTAAPQADSCIGFYNKADYSSYNQPLFLDGQYLRTSTGNTTKISTGQWNEICIERVSGYLRYFINGILFASVADTNYYYDRIYFGFGNQQQTYKYFDEFRFVNKALYGTSNYTPTSVPYDTNLSLVLPDSAMPVADEYWSFDKTITPVWSYDFTNSTQPPNAVINYSSDTPPLQYGYIQNDGYLTVTGYPVDGIAHGTSTHGYWLRAPNDASSTSTDLFNKVLTWSVVLSDGTVYSSTYLGNQSQMITTFNWGSVCSYGPYFFIRPNQGNSINIIYVECVEGTSPNTGHKFIASITPVASYTKPTLAVRTDIPITSKQIGGPRPSLPTTGMVWSLVEDGVIQSIQIYNGSAWEQCDGRIFTGTRWIPYSAYNIITLKDFYDVADASGDSYEYIYTEAGFWNWWQKSWNAFTSKLFAALGSGSSGSGSTSDTSPEVPDVDITTVQSETKDNTNFLVKVLYKLFFKDAVSTVKSSAGDFASVFGVSVADSSASSSASSSSASSSGGSGGSTVTVFPLMDGESIWD